MTKKLTLLNRTLPLVVFLFYATTLFSQNINPTPQQIKVGDGYVARPLKMIVGTKGDKSVKPFLKTIPKQAEGYYLSVDKNRIVVAGTDSRGTYYGLQTLAQLSTGDSIPLVEIIDFPDVKYRGVVEGFYGTPWSFEARLSQIKFYGQNKLNTYIYGPKDDPYHSSPHWRSPYPEAEASKIKALVDLSKEYNVDFVWAIHPGQDIQWNQADRDNLMNKFENMYRLGVRSFAVFFDDISGEGTKATQQAELLNYLNREFVEVKKDVKPLIMCPTEYNKSWANVNGGYLKTLGELLDPEIHIMWTGDRVCTDIFRSSVEWIDLLIKRPAFVWWNFPVSDYVRNHLLMGSVYGNDTNIADLVSGFVCNPMEHPEASKIAIYGVAAYAWNMTKYDADKSWNEIIAKLMPSDREALKKFVQHNSDMGINGHLYRKNESMHLLPLITSVTESLNRNAEISTENFNALRNEFTAIVESASLLMANEDNPDLLAEISPWLIQFKNVGETGLAVLDLYKAFETGDKEVFLQKYRLVKSLKKLNYNIDQTYNQNPYQPGVKTASLHVVPLIDKIFSVTIQGYNEKSECKLDSKTSYSPFKMTTPIPQLQNVLLQTKLNQVIIPPVNEIIRWKSGDYIQIDCEASCRFTDIKINIGGGSLPALILETSSDGKNWTSNEQTIEINKLFKITSTNAKYIRIKNTDVEKEVKFHRCEIKFASDR